MDYIFVFRDECWYLKVADMATLIDYFQRVEEPRMGKGFLNAVYSKELNENGKEHADKLGFYMLIHAENHGMSLMESAADITSRKMKSMMQMMAKGYTIYINRNGGWNMGMEKDYKQWVRKDKLIFPDFKKNQIKIEKFPGGQHFYAYIDGMQLRDGDTLKWNTYKEAYDYSLKFVEDAEDLEQSESPCEAEDEANETTFRSMI